MELNADFSKDVRVAYSENPWRASPGAGVERKMLDRIGDEVARATTIVRFAPGSTFAAHTHDGGEEYIVLDGVFQDEEGDFPVGTYVRNPPTSRHTPSSKPGATIFVKLWQFDPEDRQQVRIDMNAAELCDDQARGGVQTGVLFQDNREHVSLEVWASGITHKFSAPRGAEVLVLDGAIQADGETMVVRDWLRLAPGSNRTLTSGKDGARLWIKTGHLEHVLKG